MYKTLSRAVSSPAIRWGLSLAVLLVLFTLLYRNRFVFTQVTLDGVVEVGIAFFAVLFLTGLNLYCEVRKWQVLVNYPDLSDREAFRQVLSGMCSGFITPNRLGEFAGRMYLMPSAIRDKAFAMTFTGSTLQAAVTCTFGIVGILLYPIFPHQLTDIRTNLFMMSIGLLFGLVLLLVYMKKPSLFTRFSISVKHIRSIGYKMVVRAFSWAFLRYMVFATQLVIALWILGFNGSLVECYAGAFLLYFCQSYIPGSAFGELGIRELLATFIFGSFMANPLLGALAALIVWACNIGIPVMLGVTLFGISVKNGD